MAALMSPIVSILLMLRLETITVLFLPDLVTTSSWQGLVAVFLPLELVEQSGCALTQMAACRLAQPTAWPCSRHPRLRPLSLPACLLEHQVRLPISWKLKVVPIRSSPASLPPEAYS